METTLQWLLFQLRNEAPNSTVKLEAIKLILAVELLEHLSYSQVYSICDLYFRTKSGWQEVIECLEDDLLKQT